MAFIRQRQSTTGFGLYRQVIEGYRHGGKVRQRVLANLGRHDNVAARLGELHDKMLRAEQRVARLQRRGERLRQWPCSRCIQRMAMLTDDAVQFDHCACSRRSLLHARKRCQQLKAEIAQLSKLRSVKIFTAKSKVFDTTPPHSTAVDRIIDRLTFDLDRLSKASARKRQRLNGD